MSGAFVAAWSCPGLCVATFLVGRAEPLAGWEAVT